MSTFWQTVIPAALTALVAGRFAITRTGRLRKVIRVNVELLNKLPADDPTREALAAHVRELVDVLAWREHQQFHPLASRGSFSLGGALFFAVAALLWGALVLAGLTGTYPPAPEVLWLTVAFYPVVLAAMVAQVRSMVKLASQQRRLLRQALPAG
jgi:hypothetical protein